MNKISDELRDWCDRNDENGCGCFVTEYSFEELCDLADRIDAELVELPLDRDGASIHVGDTVYMDDGRMAEAYSIEFKNGETNVLCRTPSGCYVSSGYVYRLPNKLTHTRPDSWERIANELDEQAGSLTKDGYTWQEDAIHDFADRIRNLAKEQGNE